MIKRILLTSILTLPLTALSMELPAPNDDLDKDPLFDTKNLLNTDAITHHLKKYYGATPFFVTTEDGITICGTLIERENATHTTIVPGGFYPGNQETMATWARVLPANGNIILFDARGHGKSEGPFWSTIRQYGLNEYKDILAILEFAKKKEKPIIMSPLCAGALHTIHALTKLKAQDQLNDYKIRGLILDSAFTSPVAVLPAGEYHFREKAIPQLLRSWVSPNDKSSKVKEHLLYKIIWNLIGYPFISILTWLGRGGIEQNEATTRIDTKINQLSEIPMLCLHAKNDMYAPLSHAETLCANHNNANNKLVTFDDSDHANNILKKKEEYQKAVNTFIANVLALSKG